MKILAFRTDIAELWHKGAGLRREDIFGTDDVLRPEYEHRSLERQIDVTAVGMVGVDYERGGIAILSVNPAGGKVAFRSDSLSDRMYERFRELQNPRPNVPLLQVFEDVNSAVLCSFPDWTITKNHYNKILSVTGKRFDDISFLYVVPFRTKDDKGSAMRHRFVMNGYEKHLKRQLALLAPRVVVAMDRPSEVVAKYYKNESAPETTVCYWSRGHHVSDAERFRELSSAIPAC